MTRRELIDALMCGDVGEVEFMELAMDLEMDFDEIEKHLREAREDLA